MTGNQAIITTVVKALLQNGKPPGPQPYVVENTKLNQFEALANHFYSLGCIINSAGWITILARLRCVVGYLCRRGQLCKYQREGGRARERAGSETAWCAQWEQPVNGMQGWVSRVSWVLWMRLATPTLNVKVAHYKVTVHAFGLPLIMHCPC